MQRQKVADMSSSCCTAAPAGMGTSGDGNGSSPSAAAAASCADTDDAGLELDETQAVQHGDKSAVPLRQAAAAAAPNAALSAAEPSCMQLITTTAPQNAMAPDWNSFGEYCINLPVADKAQLSAALICDTLNTIPVPPKAVTQIQGPVLEVHQVDDHSVDVKIVHGFRATYDEPIADVRKRAEAYLLQQHAAEAAAAAASLQQKASAVAGQGQLQTAAAQAPAAAGYTGPSHNLDHEQQESIHSQLEQHQHHRHSDHYSDNSGLGCVCRELHEGEEGLIPDYIKRTADCVVHEQDTGTDSEYAPSQPGTHSSTGGGRSISSLHDPVPDSPGSKLQASAAGTQASAAGGKEALGSAAGAGSPFAASPFQVGNLEPFSLPSSSRPAGQQGQQQSGVAGQPPRQPYKQQAEQQDEHSVRMKVDNAAVLHGGRLLSVEVLRTADHRAGDVGGSSSAVAQPTVVHLDDTASDSTHASGQLDNHSSRPPPGQQQQDFHQRPPLISSPFSTAAAADSVPSSVGGVAVAPGPAVGQDWQQQQPVLVTLRHRKTAHGHQQIDVQPLQTADRVECQQQVEQREGSESSVYAADSEQKQQDEAQQRRLQDAVLQQQQQNQQQYKNTMTQLDMNILHPPQGFLPLSGDQAHQARKHHSQQEQQQPGQGLALVPTPQNPVPTLMMPRASAQGKLPPRAQPREGFVPRCEWELDPRKVLVGRRLAVGGFAEVFIGKYEGTVVAVKRLLTGDATTIERFVSEVRMLARLRHPNLILFMGYCTMPELCIIIEYMNKGSLYSVLHSPEQRKQRLLVAQEHQKQQQESAAPARAANHGVAASSHSSNADTSAASSSGRDPNVSSTSSKQTQGASSLGLELLTELTPAEEEKAQMEGLEPRLQRLVAIAVARGMAYLHTRNPPILHLDLKSPNILVDDRWRVKITDFGLSRARQRTFVSSTAQGGTPEWMAPEVLRCEAVAEPADVYSYGVVLWELITGRAPWENYNAMQVVAIVGFRELSVPLPATAADPFLLELCKRCLQRNPASRPTFPQIAALLDQHYGPPTWSSHAQPLMPHTPRPALLAPPAAAAASQAQLVMLQWKQQQQQEREWAEKSKSQGAQQEKETDEKEEDSARDEADVKSPAKLANAEQQQQQPGAAAAEQQRGEDVQQPPHQRDHLDVQVHVLPGQQQQENHKSSSNASGTGELPTAGGVVASVPAQPSPFSASPFAANLAPWSYESVQSMADDAAATARQPLPNSSTASDSYRSNAGWGSSSNSWQQQQQSGSLAGNTIGSSAAVGGANALDCKGDSSSVRSEVHIPVNDVHTTALRQQEQRQASLAHGLVCSTRSAALSCELSPVPECLKSRVNVGASAGGDPAAAADPVQRQQQQEQQVCSAQPQLRYPSIPSGAAAGHASWGGTRESSSGPTDSAETVVPAAATVAATAANGTDQTPAPHAVGHHLGADSTGITGSVDRQVLLDHLQPHMQAFLAAAAAAAGPGGASGIPDTDGPSSAPAGSVAHDTAAWHALLEAAASISSFHRRNSSMSSGYGGYLRSEGSYALLRGLWPTMTEESFNDLMSRAASRQVSRSSEEGANNHSRMPDGSSSGGCNPAADGSSESCQQSRQVSKSDEAEGSQCDGESRTSVHCNSSSGCSPSAAGSSQGCKPVAEPAVGEGDFQQQQQHVQPDAPVSDAAISDCSRSSSSDTSRSHQPHGQDSGRESCSQLVYQVWPVMVAPNGDSAAADAVADATADVTIPLDIPAMLRASSPAAMAKRATKNGRASPAAAAPNGFARSVSDSAVKQLGVKQLGGPRSGSANGITPTVAAAKQYEADVGMVDCDVNGLSSDVCAALHRLQWEPQDQVADMQPDVSKPHQQQQQQVCDAMPEPPAAAAAAAKHVLNYSMQQPNRGHSVDASMFRHAAQHSSSTAGSSYQKGRFMVSTTAAPAAATPPKARGTGSGRSSQRSSHSNLAAVDFAAAAAAAVMPGSVVQQQQQQPAKQVVPSGPRSVPCLIQLQQQQESAVGIGAAPVAAAAVSTAAAASVAAMCSADLSLNLMSAFACPSANVAHGAHDLLAASTCSTSSAAVPTIAASPAVAVTAEGAAQQKAYPAEVAERPMAGLDPSTDNSSRGLAPKGVWGSGVVREGSSLASAGESLPCVIAPSAAALQQSFSSTCSRDSFSCYHHQRLRGCSSPGAVGPSGRTVLAAAGRVDGPLSQPATSTHTQMLQMHFSTGGLCYRTGRFSVTVQQQEVQQGAGATSPAGGTRVSSSTTALATAAATDAPVSAVLSPTVVTLGPLSPASALGRPGAVFRTISDRQRPTDTQQHGIIHPSASCGALPLLAAQQQMSATELLVMPQSLAADAASVTGGSVAAVTAAAAGTESHPLDGEMSTCSYVSTESTHSVHMQQQQHVVHGHTGSAAQCGTKQPQQQQQGGSTSPLHQRRLLAQPPAQLMVPASADLELVPCTLPPLQQQIQQQAAAVDPQTSSSAAAAPPTKRPSRTSDPSHSTHSSMMSASQTVSCSSSSAVWSPRSTPAAPCSISKPAAKPPLVPLVSKTPSPIATPLHSPRLKAAAVTRDYCRGRFQIHECPLMGPWQACRSTSSSSACIATTPTADVCGPCPTPVAAVVESAAVTSLQQQQQPVPSAVSAAQMVGSRVSPQPASVPLCPTNAAAAPQSGSIEAATVKKMGRFTVKHESSSSLGHCVSRPGSTASSTQASRSGSPRGEHPTHHSKLGSSRYCASASCDRLSSSAASSVIATPTAGGSAGKSMYRSSSDLARQQQQHGEKQQQQWCLPAPALKKASAVAPSKLEDSSANCVELVNGSARSSGACDAAAAPATSAVVPAMLAPATATSALVPATSAPATATSASSTATSAPPQLAPIRTISKKGRFVVTQTTPGSTACSTPKSGIPLAPAAASCRSASSSFTAESCEVTAAGACSKAGSASDPAAAAAAWLSAAAASGAADAAAAAVVISCPVCDTPHAVCAAAQSAAVAPQCAVAATAASHRPRSPLPPASPVAAAAVKSSGKAAVTSGAATACTRTSSILTSPGKPPRSSNSCINYKISSPSNTPRPHSPLPTCISCGAPLPPVGPILGAVMEPSAAIAAVLGATSHQEFAASCGLVAGDPTVAATAGDDVAAATAAVGAVPYAAVQPSDVFQNVIPRGLLAEAVTRVLAARQQEQLAGIISPECSSTNFASGSDAACIGVEASSARSSDSSICGTAAPAAAGPVAGATVPGHFSGGTCQVSTVVPMPAWQLPLSHALQCDAHSITELGSNSSNHHGSNCSSPVSSLVLSGDNALAAAVSSPAQVLMQQLQQPGLQDVGLSRIPDLGSAAQESQTSVTFGTKPGPPLGLTGKPSAVMLPGISEMSVAPVVPAVPAGGISSSAGPRPGSAALLLAEHSLTLLPAELDCVEPSLLPVNAPTEAVSSQSVTATAANAELPPAAPQQQKLQQQ